MDDCGDKSNDPNELIIRQAHVMLQEIWANNHVLIIRISMGSSLIITHELCNYFL